jgi:hypothetical protein
MSIPHEETKMSNIIAQNPMALTLGEQRLPSKVKKAVEHEAHRGLVQAANIQAVAYVTHVAQHLVGVLSLEQEQIIEMCPSAEPRIRMLVDSCAYRMARAIQEL